MVEIKRSRAPPLRYLVKSESRCVYCARPPAQIEHMPPKSMFRSKSRPKGLEFAACNVCNNGTSAADLVASFIARLDPFGSLESWKHKELIERQDTLHRAAPGLLNEVLHPSKVKRSFRPNHSGVYVDTAEVVADGPLAKSYLIAFSAKMAMALFREHVGAALPLTGAVLTQHFLNAGLAAENARAMLNMMPAVGELRQGSFDVKEQFSYRFNCDEKSILAALVSFQGNLHVFAIAADNPTLYFRNAPSLNTYTTSPGEIEKWMPTRQFRDGMVWATPTTWALHRLTPQPETA